jgi:hypothetical protein
MSNLDNELKEAFQAKHIKQILVQAENRIRTRRRRIILFSSFSAVAAAACIMLGIFIHADSQYMAGYSANYLSQAITNTARGDSEIDSLLSSAIMNIKDNKCDTAEKELNKALSIMTYKPGDEKKGFSSEEEHYKYNIEMVQRDDITWYKTLIFMQRGKVFKARKMLKMVANSESSHKHEAEIILSKLY